MSTKLKFYHACVLTALFYACETWVVYHRQMKWLWRFHQYYLCHILGIIWKMSVSDVEVLERCGCDSVKTLTLKHQLRQASHLVRMNDSCIPKQLFYGELWTGKRNVVKPKMHFKDCIKDALKKYKIPCEHLEECAADCNNWMRLLVVKDVTMKMSKGGT